MSSGNVNTWLLDNMVCPRDGYPLEFHEGVLHSMTGNRYPVVDGIPVMVLEEKTPTHRYCIETIEELEGNGIPLHEDKNSLDDVDYIDSFVQGEVAKTCGIMYRPLVNKLKRYPIPDFPLTAQSAELVLDIGCNWGRWCFSAARKGFRPVGIDPSLAACLAAKRVAEQIGLDCCFVCGDARHLPFRKGAFDLVYSYSVLQHFSKQDVKSCLQHVKKVLKPSGFSYIQMPNRFGVRNVVNQIVRGLREAQGFEVRYWSMSELIRTFDQQIGPSSVEVEGFFSLGSQLSDVDLLPLRYKIVVYLSNILSGLAMRFPFLINFADSIFIKSSLLRAKDLES